MCHCGLEASPSSVISSVRLFTLYSGNLCFFAFSSGLTEISALLEAGAGTRCDYEYYTRNNIVFLDIII